ncbi:hypothetical protein GG344DRAFT_55241, partial [Lentinula edodes]
ALQLLLFNEEYLVSASHQLALITSLPFVHTARRYYRLTIPSMTEFHKITQTFRPRKKTRWICQCSARAAQNI